MSRLPAVIVLLLAGCTSGGHLSVLGYTTAPPFDPEIRTVYVPVFKTGAFQTTPFRGMEVDITKAVVRELGSRPGAPRVVDDPERADTELVGLLMNIQKRELTRNQQNHVREMEIAVTCSVVWRDLRNGRVLTNPRPGKENAPPPPVFDPSLPPPPELPVNEAPNPVVVTATGRLFYELGETTATANKAAVDQLARQIVNMMEKPW